MDRRQRERQELRLRILDAARELFATGGVEAVTLRRVAERIGYTATTIYLYFRDKDELLDELCTADFANHSRVFRQAERESDPILRLHKAAAAYLDFGLGNPALYRLMFNPSVVRSDGTERARDAGNDAQASPLPLAAAGQALTPYDFLYSAVFKAVAAGCFLPQYRDVAGTTQLLWGGLHGVVSLHLARARHPSVPWKPVEAAAAAMVDCLIDGMSGGRAECSR